MESHILTRRRKSAVIQSYRLVGKTEGWEKKHDVAAFVLQPERCAEVAF